MGLLDSLVNRLGYSRRQSLVDPAQYALYGTAKTELPAHPPAWLLNTARGESYAMPDPDKALGQAEIYRKLSWVHAAIDAVSNFAGTVPFEVKERRGSRLEDIDNHPFEVLLSRPNPLQSRFEFLVEIVSHYRISGNAYVWRNQSGQGAAPLELWVLPPSQVTPVPDGRLFLAGYEYDPLDGSKPVILAPWEVLHLRMFNPFSWFLGLSPLESLRLAALGDLAQARWNYDLFAKNNAKAAGALAFADNINNTTWSQMREDIRAQHGGAVRNDLMLLRGAGQGAVRYLPMAMSQREMEFLEGRKFTKEEIFGLYAPGYASMIDVNATEANAKAGESTFRALAVWPVLSALAEKITNDLLPAYGANLVGVFEDIRLKDRALDLAEGQEFARTHTIDEVRERAGSKPIGDERGGLLVAQITPQSGGIQEVAPPALSGALPEGQENDQSNKEDKEEEPTEEDDDAAEEDAAAKASEARAYRRWLKGARKTGAKRGFSAAHHTQEELQEIADEVFGVESVAAQAQKQRMIPSPLDDDLRSQVEREFAAQVEMSLRQWLQAVLPPGTSEVDVLGWEQRLLTGQARFRDVLEIALHNATDLGTSTAFGQVRQLGFAFDYTLVNQTARDWARQYSYDLVTQITDVTRQQLQAAVGEWVESGEALPALVRRIQAGGTFGRDRALLIAQTETTRAYAEAEEIAYRESGVRVKEWDAVNDRLVCPQCGTLHGRRVPVGAEFAPGIQNPPAHPGCRCSTRPVVEV